MEEVSNIGEEIKKYNMKKYSNNLYLWDWKSEIKNITNPNDDWLIYDLSKNI